jgi:hypothetical protein
MSPKQKRHISKGTGKRYTSDRPAPQAVVPVRNAPPPASSAERALRNSISRFGLSHRFHEDFERAFEQYMGSGTVQKQGDKRTLMLDENDVRFPGFQEWFYFDYALQSGERIIDLFVKEVGPELNSTQRKILDDWLVTNRLRLLETQSVEPGIGETMQDLLSGEILRLNDISFSYTASRWMVFLGRTILTEERWSFTGSGALFTPLEKPRLLKIAKKLWAEYQQEHSQAGLLDFYRGHSLDLYQAGEEIQEDRGKPEEVFTAEGHPAISAKAEFTIQGNPGLVEGILDHADEFVFQNEQKTGEFSGCLHYIWLLRGRSSVPEAPEPTKGTRLIGTWTLGPGEPDFRRLGDVYACQDRLTLLCLSRERLEAGKELLSYLFGDEINYQEDQFSDLRKSIEEMKSKKQEDLEDEEDSDEADMLGPDVEIVTEELIERYTRRWLDTLGRNGLSPRQMAQTPEGRAELQERMKEIEYIVDQALKSGKRPPMRLDIIRKELEL